MSRSLCVKPEWVSLVKAALRNNSYPSQTALAGTLGLSRDVINRFFNGKPVDYINAVEICHALNLDLGEITGYGEPRAEPRRTSWPEGVGDTFKDSERERELETLEGWILEENCRLVLIKGMAGMGKTNLSLCLGKRIEKHFDLIIWLSLDQYTSIDDLFQDLLNFFSNGTNLENNVPNLQALKTYLIQYRCLLILANIDVMIKDYRLAPEYRKYQDLLRLMMQQDQGCLIMTSDCEPQEIALMSNQLCRSLVIEPLPISQIKNIFNRLGSFSGREEDWEKLQNTYKGNPFVLNNVAANIQASFQGNITNFISYGNFVFKDIQDFLREQLGYLSNTELEVMYWLAIYHHSINIFELKDIVPSLSGDQLLTIVEHLKLRFFIEGEGDGIIIQPPMIREYFLNRLVNDISEEIQQSRFDLLVRFPLLTTAAKAEVRKDQEKFLLKPIVSKLCSRLGTRKTRELLDEILRNTQLDSYGAGNIINLLHHSNTPVDLRDKDFSNKDFSNLVVKNADFRNVELHNSNFSNTELSGCLFLEALSNVLSVVFSPDGQFLAIGDTNDHIYLWKITENRPILHQIITSHNHWVRTLAFSPDSKIIASSGEDGRVYLRQVETGRLIATFEGHIDKVRSLTFSPDGKFLASSSDDRTVRIWNLNRHQLLSVLNHHTDKVRSVVFHPQGNTLISASQDNTICLWIMSPHGVELSKKFDLSRECKHFLLRAIAISPDGKMLATGNDDGVVRLWDLKTSKFSKEFPSHNGWIRSLAFSPNGKWLASASEDETIRICDVTTSNCLHILKGHNGRIWSIAFHPFRSWLVAGDDALKVKLWHTQTGECLGAFQGYSQETRPLVFSPDSQTLAVGNNQATVNLKDSTTGRIQVSIPTNNGNIWSLAYSPDGNTLIGASDHKTVEVWEILTPSNPSKSLRGHGSWVRTVAFSADGDFFASASDDKTIKLWDAHTLKCLKTFTFEDDYGHTDWVRSVCFHPTSEKFLLASASDDGTIKLWNIKTHKLINTLNEERNNEQKLIKILNKERNNEQIRAIAISPQGNLLASSSNNNTITIWNLATYQRITTLREHRNWVSSVAFSPDGKWLASASYDTTIRLWELDSGCYECHQILQGHGKAVVSIAFHPTQEILVSSSKDGSIKHWDLTTGACIKDWKTSRPYENMNITGVMGLNSAQKQCLKDLGAIENHD